MQRSKMAGIPRVSTSFKHSWFFLADYVRHYMELCVHVRKYKNYFELWNKSHELMIF